MSSLRLIARAIAIPVVLWIIVLAVVRVVVVPPENCGPISPESARASAAAAGDWIIDTQRPDGSYTYEYNRDLDSLPDDYNIVRHAGVTMSLYQIAGRLDSPEALASADRATEWMLDRLKRHDDWAALSDDNTGKLGSTALMAVALAERRLATGDTRHDDVMAELGRFMVALQRPDGGFSLQWLFDAQMPDPVGTSIYYPGEALWALALLHEALPGEGFDQAAWSAADFITLHRDEVEEIPFPPLNDHWASYGLAEMVEWGLAEHHVAYARDLAGRFSLLMRLEAQGMAEDPMPSLRGEPRRAASLGTWVEGTSALWRLSAQDDRLSDIEDGIRDRAACGAGILLQRQVSPDAQTLEAGAWFEGGVTRMDDQQHAISGLLYIADALEDRTRREPDDRLARSLK